MGVINQKVGDFRSSEHESPNSHLGPRFWPVELGLLGLLHPVAIVMEDFPNLSESASCPQPRFTLLLSLVRLRKSSALNTLFHLLRLRVPSSVC